MKNITVVIIVLAVLFMVAGIVLDVTNFSARSPDGYGLSKEMFYAWGLFILIISLIYETSGYRRF